MVFANFDDVLKRLDEGPLVVRRDKVPGLVFVEQEKWKFVLEVISYTSRKTFVSLKKQKFEPGIISTFVSLCSIIFSNGSKKQTFSVSKLFTSVIIFFSIFFHRKKLSRKNYLCSRLWSKVGPSVFFETGKVENLENRKKWKSGQNEILKKVEKWWTRKVKKSEISIMHDFGGRKGGILKIGPVRQKLPYFRLLQISSAMTILHNAYRNMCVFVRVCGGSLDEMRMRICYQNDGGSNISKRENIKL